MNFDWKNPIVQGIGMWQAVAWDVISVLCVKENLFVFDILA